MLMEWMSMEIIEIEQDAGLETFEWEVQLTCYLARG